MMAVGVQPGFSGWDESWQENTCIYTRHNIPYMFDANCDVTQLDNRVPSLAHNQFYFPGAAVNITCGKQTFTSLAQWQNTPQRPDAGTTVKDSALLSVADIIAMGKSILK
jgi:hypothetical protein